jgi:hypothetical protein
MATPSGSSLGRAFACGASMTLPRADSISDAGTAGTVKHEFLANLQGMGRDDALALVPEEFREACEVIDLSVLPVGAEWTAELAVVYDFEKHAARIVGHNIGRNYGALRPTEIPMTIDLLGRADVPMVIDHKTGWGWVTRARDNWQLRGAAVAVSKLLKVDAVRVGLLFLRDGAAPDWDSTEFDAFDLANFEDELTKLPALEKAARLVTGSHCRYCPSFQFCPAQTGLARRMASPEDLAEAITDAPATALTPELAAKAWERLKAAEYVLKSVRESLRLYAEATPIPLGEGIALGRVEKEVDEIDADKARATLEGLYGREVAEKACGFDTSKKAIGDALRIVYEKRKQSGEKVTLKDLNAEALGAIRDAGGIGKRKKSEVREFEL